ncbi:MAG TPA: DUF308 domain-containing protein [Thermodesulfobacteriota bacterium]|nr:DUF308 domain-containing protein [Thermodesulfobacteriota bacterium]
MNPNRRIFFYQGGSQGKPPAYLLPLAIIIGLALFALLAIFGLVIGIAIGIAVIVFGAARFVSSFGKKKKKVHTTQENGRTTIILDTEDYEVIEKKKGS